jgi:hypothetical protein
MFFFRTQGLYLFAHVQFLTVFWRVATGRQLSYRPQYRLSGMSASELTADMFPCTNCAEIYKGDL